jgi:hypothetical protein
LLPVDFSQPLGTLGSRSAPHRLHVVAYGVGLSLEKQAVGAQTPGGCTLLEMSAVFAEFERERVLASHARAIDSGVRFGWPTIPACKAAAVVFGLKSGIGVLKLAKAHGVGVGTVQRLKFEVAASGA